MTTGFKRIHLWDLFGALSLLSTFILSGCSFMYATENSDPYTADDVIAMVEEKFAACNPHLVLEETQIEKEKPFQRTIYVLRDEANDFTFSCNAVVRRPTLPLPCAQRDTNAFFHYATGYAAHLNEHIRSITAEYNFRTATTEEAEMLIHSNATRKHLNRQVPLFEEGDFIFVTDGAQGADMTAACKRLYELYRPKGDGTLLSALYGRSITFYYLTPAEEDLTKATFIASFFLSLKGSTDWASTLSVNQGSSSNEKDPAVMEKNLSHYFDICLRKAQEAAQRKTGNHAPDQH